MLTLKASLDAVVFISQLYSNKIKETKKSTSEK